MFKVGDEVVCVFAGNISGNYWRGDQPVEGAVYKVARAGWYEGEASVSLDGMDSQVGDGSYRASRFRKVQRKTTDLSIESFLTIRPGFEEPRKVTAPVKEKA